MKLGVYFTKSFWQQTITAHAHPNAWLTELKYKAHARSRYDSADGNKKTDFSQVDLFKNIRQGIRYILKFRVVNHACYYQCHHYINYCANKE
jgi:hypothetical protein